MKNILFVLFVVFMVYVWGLIALGNYYNRKLDEYSASRLKYLDSSLKYVFVNDALYKHYNKLSEEESLKFDLTIEKFDKMMWK